MEGLRDFSDPQVMPFDELLALGRAHDAAHPGLWEERVAGSKAEDLAMLVYTSGTTGPPKGAMLSHRNVVFQMRNADAFIPLGTDDEQLAFLPLCHIAERTVAVFLPLRSGAIVNFVENPETVPENVREIAPTIFFAVPRIWEKLLFRRRHPHEGGDLDRPHGLPLGARRRPRGGRGASWRAAGRRSRSGGCTRVADFLVLDNIAR